MFDFVRDVRIDKIGNGYGVGVLTAPAPHGGGTRNNTIAFTAESVRSALTGVLESFPIPLRSESSSRKRSALASGDWSFNTLPSYEQAVDIYLNHPEKIRSFTVLEKNIKIPPTTGNEIFYDVEGDWLDVDRYLEGQPEVFGQGMMGNPANLFANVVINTTAVCDFNEASMRRRGERIVRLVDWLEAQRIRTRIMVFSSNSCAHVEVQVKKFEDSFDIDALTVACHPDFFRRMIFRIMEYSKTWESGYGYASMVCNNLMQMPQLDHNGILILSENRKAGEMIDKLFDQAENDIEAFLEDGQTIFSMNL